MNKINTMEEFYQIIERDRYVLVYFYTKWCPDCFMAKPYLPKLEKEFVEIEFNKMDRDGDLALAKHLNIFGIPSFLVYKNGEEIGRFVSKNRKSYTEVRNFILDTLSK